MTKISAFLTTLFELLSSKKEFILLIIRLSVSAVFIQTGWGKLVHIKETTAFFEVLHIPFPFYNAVLASLTECLGGICIGLGFATRLMSIPLTVIMAIAIITAQSGDIHSIADFIRLQEWDYIMFFLFLLFNGPGRYSLDTFIRKIFPSA